MYIYKILDVEDIKTMELCGPYECPCCGNCVMLSAPCIDDQVEPKVKCPYCDKIIWVPEWIKDGILPNG